MRWRKNDEVVSRLLQADRDSLARKVRLQLPAPLLEGFRAGADPLMFSAAVPQVEEVQIGRFVGSIQSNDDVEGCRVHNLTCDWLGPLARSHPATAI